MNTPYDAEKIARELDWNLLRTFMVIVQEGSITRAANRLLLQQPSVSQALQRLEARIGTTLIDRAPSHFRVTSAGQMLYEECAQIFGTISRAVQTAQTTTDELTGHVTIATLSRVESPHFDQILSDFHSQHPQVRFDIDVLSSKAVQKAVLEKSASLGLCLVYDPHPKLEHSIMYRAYFGFYCGPSHPLFGKTGLTLDDLRGHSSISFRTDQLTDALRPVALVRAQHRLDERVIGYTSHLGEALRMITAGLGFGPLPSHTADQYVAQGQLWRLPPYENMFEIDIYLVHNPNARLNTAETAFFDKLNDWVSATDLEERTYFPAH
ncbi:HTH-type transcriptional regulator CysL [Roseovarius albus]|uniref:HTH-type transcriptional regulator CysL n=1 Tax=Roseovarius albus TaxID=1247867 RepID=A0A1X6Z9H4_9RHOB|nr:LysR family transcriptional regulator [Roseovarius albus]SLN44877.1 HTH-type transcriptional regulator CysL [Roseovarius albus]